ncbi:ATP-binding protein [Pelovirga terrestris]|uniref:histidine kinase n=1 Tax=Pelovirga terrestris TaxID=2771352 RepID=A0A8J6UHL1_9BACT|nr:ATP-binding protein [Pelovirga terrestris]MBD1399480.1 HAMP domain-containing protein [Pelovirga terrestris]
MVRTQPEQSIKNKLVILLMLISVLLLLVFSLVVLTAEIFATRAALIQEIRVLAAAIGSSSRQALVLGQYQETEKFLAALTTQKHIHAAYLFNHQGEPVAEYLSHNKAAFTWRFLEKDFNASNKAHWTTATEEQIHSSLSHLGVFIPIFYTENRIGTIYVLSDLATLYGRLSGVALGTTLSLMLLFIFSWFLAGRLHKPVSEPLLNLAGVMEKISVQQDYSVRATKMSNDEIALLVDGLNHMLDQVEDYQRQQSRYQDHLELTVHQRTAELRTAVAELNKARQLADSANEAKSQFLSRMTHELRTPLIGVLGMNGLLQRTALTEYQRTLVDTVDSSGNDLLALISDVLDIARIEAGVIELEHHEIVPADMVAEVVALLKPQAQAKGVELIADIPTSALRRIRGDRARIRQIMMNLIGNAIKFTPKGTITVGLQLVSEQQELGQFIFIVKDTGIGMDEATSRRIFELFYQDKSLPSEGALGSGLGLPIVKQLVDLMGGNITVASRPGEGSCFTVELSLPLLEQIPSTKPVTKADVISPSSAPRVLYVGRHAAERQLLRLTLAVWQAVPVFVDNLQQAVAMCQRAHVVLLILDAAELTPGNLKELQALKNELPPCCLLGDYESADLITDPLLGYLEKPLNQTALRRIIDPLLVTSATASSVAAGKAG